MGFHALPANHNPRQLDEISRIAGLFFSTKLHGPSGALNVEAGMFFRGRFLLRWRNDQTPGQNGHSSRLAQ
jgi:hypothetical protein